MFRYSQHKKALIIATIVILLCFAAITGSTLALFTSGNDGKIGINTTAGDLKVDIIDTSEDDPQSLVGDVLNFETTKDKDIILFEPGAMYYTEGFRVQNKGNIPMNYILYISQDEEEGFVNDFTEAFEVWLTTNPKDKDNMVKLQQFDGRLGVGETSETFHLVFRMKETAGNEFQNRTFTGVGITVCAVQGNAVIK